jgi:hypothetical protein
MVAVLAYEQAIASRLLSRAGERLAASLLAHERVHVAQLRAALIRLGGTPPQPPASLSEADQVLSANRITISLKHLHDAHDTIILLAEVEFLLEDSFRHAISRLRDPRASLLCLRTMAVEAQHGVALSELLHPGDVKKAVPSSFV